VRTADHAVPGESAMRWDYKIIQASTVQDLQDQLTQAGEERFELVHVDVSRGGKVTGYNGNTGQPIISGPYTDNWTAILKRQDSFELLGKRTGG
jgi:hypothetical protein